MNKYTFLFTLVVASLVLSAQGMHVTKARVVVAAAGLVGVAVYGTSPEWVKPAWAVKHVPNGVPKQLNDQIEFMRNPERFTKLGAELPRGILLYGPPGTGKTSIARAIAEELDATFIVASGTDFTSHLYGKGSEKVRKFFADARKEAERQKGGLTIAFIDELDIIVPPRSSRAAEGYSEQITTFLTEIDGFVNDPKIKIYLIGATNRKDAIDPAILRAGRLETHIEIPLPTAEGREDILRHYLKKIAYKGPDVCGELARDTDGMSGADLKKLVNDAAIIAGSEKALHVAEKHLRAAAAQLRKLRRVGG